MQQPLSQAPRPQRAAADALLDYSARRTTTKACPSTDRLRDQTGPPTVIMAFPRSGVVSFSLVAATSASGQLPPWRTPPRPPLRPMGPDNGHLGRPQRLPLQRRVFADQDRLVAVALLSTPFRSVPRCRVCAPHGNRGRPVRCLERGRPAHAGCGRGVASLTASDTKASLPRPGPRCVRDQLPHSRPRQTINSSP